VELRQWFLPEGEIAMMLMTYTTIGVLAFAALWLVGKGRGRLAVAVTTLSRPASPVDEAERVLSRRYARGAISADEYGRMMAILRP
jgi:uncharacterized membrane protein